MAKSVCAKIDDGNICSVLRILLSENKPAEDNDATYDQLIERHPTVPTNQKTYIPAKPDLLGNHQQVNKDDVKKAIRSFASSDGPDGLRPQHILDLLSCNDSGPAILSAITAFINMLLRGHCPSQVIPVLFGANLTTPVKNLMEFVQLL